MAKKNNSVNKKINKISNFLIYGFLCIFGLIFLWAFLSPVSIGASDGIHNGIVTAVEYNSNILWSANLVYFKSSIGTSQEDRYCVNDESVKAQLVDESKNKEVVTIYYKNNLFMWKWQCNGGESIIYKVEPQPTKP